MSTEPQVLLVWTIYIQFPDHHTLLWAKEPPSLQDPQGRRKRCKEIQSCNQLPGVCLLLEQKGEVCFQDRQ